MKVSIISELLLLLWKDAKELSVSLSLCKNLLYVDSENSCVDCETKRETRLVTHADTTAGSTAVAFVSLNMP